MTVGMAEDPYTDSLQNSLLSDPSRIMGYGPDAPQQAPEVAAEDKGVLALGDEIAVGAEGLEGLTVADEGAADRVVRAPAETPGAKAAVEARTCSMVSQWGKSHRPPAVP